MAGLVVDLTKLAPLIPWVIVWLAIEAAVDIVITAILSRALWRSRTGLARTNTVIHRCIKAAIQSGLFSSVFAFASLFTFALWNTTYLYTIFSWPLGRIYSYSLLYTLVIRKELSEIVYGASDAGDVRMNSFPTSLRISSVHFRQNTVADSRAGNVKSPLDRCIVLPPPKGSA
ncbi:hypothetical protein DL96DRAFT_793252 [Flagelloscypha sp. PMI_526]|nr:hypothetical protein DL96DRAFT_793252 [Flagelloscypha sp. PMI_526]